MQISQQLSYAACSQPFSHLGPIHNKDSLIIRVWRPDAKSITLTWPSAASINDVVLTLNTKTGVFEGEAPTIAEKYVYTVVVSVSAVGQRGNDQGRQTLG